MNKNLADTIARKLSQGVSWATTPLTHPAIAPIQERAGNTPIMPFIPSLTPNVMKNAVIPGADALSKLPQAVQGGIPAVQAPGVAQALTRQMGRFAGLTPTPLDLATLPGYAKAMRGAAPTRADFEWNKAFGNAQTAPTARQTMIPAGNNRQLSVIQGSGTYSKPGTYEVGVVGPSGQLEGDVRGWQTPRDIANILREQKHILPNERQEYLKLVGSGYSPKEADKMIKLGQAGFADLNTPMGEYQNPDLALRAHYQVENGGFSQLVGNYGAKSTSPLYKKLAGSLPKGTREKVLNIISKARTIADEIEPLEKAGNYDETDYLYSKLAELDNQYYKYSDAIQKALNAKPITDVGIFGQIQQNAGKNKSFPKIFSEMSTKVPGQVKGQLPLPGTGAQEGTIDIARAVLGALGFGAAPFVGAAAGKAGGRLINAFQNRIK